MDQYKVLYIGRDLDFQNKIVKAFSSNYDIQYVRATAVAAELIQSFRYDVIVFDESILATETFDGTVSTSIKLIYKISILKNIKSIFLYLYEKNSNFIKSFQKLSEATLFFKKDTITNSKIAYSLSLLKRAKYRSILAREIQVGKSYPMPIYFIDKDDKNKKVFLEANKPIENNILELLKSKRMVHLFVKAEDFSKYIEEVSATLPTNKVFAVKLNNVRKRVKKLLTYLSDDSTSQDYLVGGIHQKLVQEICDDLDKLISSFPDLLDAAEELPFPRSTLLNHCINTTIYILIFNRVCFIEHRDYVANAALLHDIGLAQTDYILPENNKTETKLTMPFPVPYESHIQASIDIMRDKKLILSPVVKDLIFTHHELADGTGGPLGKNQKQLQEYQMMLPIADYLDELRTLNPTDVENTFVDTLRKFIELETNHKQFGRLGPAFNTTIIQQIKGYFNIE